MDVYGRISIRLAEDGWCVSDGFVPTKMAEALSAEMSELYRQGQFRLAGMGRGDGYMQNLARRSDWINWLDPLQCTSLQRYYLGELEKLRLAINQEMFLGILDLECHLSIYGPGAFYERHLDQFQGSGERLVTCILYLNNNWVEEDGGQLNIYLEGDEEEGLITIDPLAGRLVTFLSGRYYHAVLPTQKDRLSITGWFKSPSKIC